MLGVFLISNIVGCFPFDLNFSNIRNCRSPLIHPLLYPNIFVSFSYSAQTFKKTNKTIPHPHETKCVDNCQIVFFFFAIEIREKKTRLHAEKWSGRGGKLKLFCFLREEEKKTTNKVIQFLIFILNEMI